MPTVQQVYKNEMGRHYTAHLLTNTVKNLVKYTQNCNPLPHALSILLQNCTFHKIATVIQLSTLGAKR